MPEPLSEPSCRPLVEALSEVPDFRQPQGLRHPLSAILALACAATLCGYKSYGAMAQWGRSYGRDLARTLGFPGGKTPAVGTLHTVLSGLDKEALEVALSGWAECVLAHLPRKSPPAQGPPAPPLRGLAPDGKTLRGIALDGKTLRGSQGQGACDVHLLSAVSHGLMLLANPRRTCKTCREILIPHLMPNFCVGGLLCPCKSRSLSLSPKRPPASPWRPSPKAMST